MQPRWDPGDPHPVQDKGSCRRLAGLLVLRRGECFLQKPGTLLKLLFVEICKHSQLPGKGEQAGLQHNKAMFLS